MATQALLFPGMGAWIKPWCSSRQKEGNHTDSQAIKEQSSEEISSFKRSLLKGKWSQNASTNKFAPRDEQEMRSGQNNTCGRVGNELEGI